MIVSLELGERNHPGGWRLNPFWIALMGDPNKILLPLNEFIDLNRGDCLRGNSMGHYEGLFKRPNDTTDLKN